ncbi:MAG: hypothetical protein R3C61_16965 [Bacteroidia bacterium]
MATLSHHLTIYPGRNTALIIVSLGELYIRGSKSLLNFMKTGFTWLVLLLFSPLLILSGLGLTVVVLLFYRKVNQTMAQIKAETTVLEEQFSQMKNQLTEGKSFSELEPVFDHQTYFLMKKQQEQGIEIDKKFEELEKIKPEGNPPVFVKPLFDFVDALRNYNRKQSELLEFLDRESPRGNWFENVPEKTLWDNRNKAYEYLV